MGLCAAEPALAQSGSKSSSRLVPAVSKGFPSGPVTSGRATPPFFGGHALDLPLPALGLRAAQAWLNEMVSSGWLNVVGQLDRRSKRALYPLCGLRIKRIKGTVLA